MSKPKKIQYWLGIDEVGRGPIAGPVTLGVFCVEAKHLGEVKKILNGITDSKKLSEKRREEYVRRIKDATNNGLCFYATSSVSAKLIDKKGIMCSVDLALNRALERLGVDPDDSFVSLDGGLAAPAFYKQETIIKGDSKNWLIGAASVIAKVHRDHKMQRYAIAYPQYHFQKHKGYGTKQHYEMIQKYGASVLHRKSWLKD